MADTAPQPQFVDAIMAINAAVRNLRLYPPGSAIIQASLAKVLQTLTALLAQADQVVCAEVEKTLIIDSQPLSDKELEKPQVRAFLETLRDLGVRTLTLCRGLEKSEVDVFLGLLSRKPEEIESLGGLHAVVRRERLAHILIDNKRFVALDKGQRIAPASGADEASAGAPGLPPVVGAGGGGPGADPRARVLYSGLQPFADLAEGGSSADAQAAFDRLITELAGMGAEGLPKAIEGAAAAAGDLEVDALALLLRQSSETEAADQFHRQLLDHLDDDKFRQVADGLRSTEAAGAAAAYRRMLESPKGRRLLGDDGQDGGREQAATDRLTRLKSAVEEVLQGARGPFEDSDLLQDLPGAARQLIAKNRTGTFEMLMDRIGQAMADPAPTIRSNATGALARILERLPEAGQADSVMRMLPRIGDLVEREDKSSPAVDTLFAQLKAVVQSHIRHRRYAAANRVLEALNRAAENPRAAEAMRNVVGSLMHTIADEPLLQMLVEAHQGSPEDVKPAIVKTMRLLMPASADSLLHRLRTSESRSERGYLMRLLPELGDGLRPEILEQIERGGQWYYLRNLVGLLGVVGKAEDLPLIETLLGHSDPRVQSEALGSIYNIGDARRGPILLDFLPVADDSLKLSVVAMLGALAYGPATAALVEQLESRVARSGKLGEELALKICVALGRIADPAAIPALERVLQPRGLFGRAPNQKLQDAARQALAQIRKTPRPAKSEVSPAVAAPAAAQGAVAFGEAEIDRLAADGETDTAVERLLALIGVEAKAKRFAEAERLRDKLYEIDALALGSIIQAGEIIEAEKSQAIDSDHLKIFASLYERLSESERNALYHAMTLSTFSPAAVLIAQGQENDRLCFINRGDVKVVFHKENRDTLVQWLGAGGLVGAESFFKATVATVSAVSLGRVEASILVRADLDALAADHPGLAVKLQDYSLGLDDTADRLRRKGMDRRRHRRIALEGKVIVQLLHGPGRPAGRPFAGSLADFSVGGVAFYLRSSRSDAARVLLGRRIELHFTLPAPSPVSRVDIQGTVIGAQELLENEYTIHVRFEQPMDPAIVDALDPQGKSGE